MTSSQYPADEVRTLTPREMSVRHAERLHSTRKLGFKGTITPPDDIDLMVTNGWLALANLEQGDVFRVGNREYAVGRISDKTLELLFEENGTTVRWILRANAEKIEHFKRDVEGMLVAACHGVDAGALTTAIGRDCGVKALREFDAGNLIRDGLYYCEECEKKPC